jgi:hypothetical protein
MVQRDGILLISNGQGTEMTQEDMHKRESNCYIPNLNSLQPREQMTCQLPPLIPNFLQLHKPAELLTSQ